MTTDTDTITTAGNFETTPAQRARIRELAQRPDMDDYDRSVIELLDDFAKALMLLAILGDSAARKSPVHAGGTEEAR